MRRAAVLGVAGALLGAGSAQAGVAAEPFVGPAGKDPLTVRGARFQPAERVTVRVIVRGGPSLTKTVRANARGSFSVRFPTVTLGPCASYAIRATGARGSRAAYTMHPPPCGPAP